MKTVKVKSWLNCTPTNITVTLSELGINEFRKKLRSLAYLDRDIESLIVKMTVQINFEVDGVSYSTTVSKLVIGMYSCDFVMPILFEWGDESEEVWMTSFPI